MIKACVCDLGLCTWLMTAYMIDVVDVIGNDNLYFNCF
jgi:hypothetical protein